MDARRGGPRGKLVGQRLEVGVPGQEDYAAAAADFLKQATAFQKKGLHALKVYGPAPVCQMCATITVPGDKTFKGYWWCPQCKATRGDRKPP
ncbi:hypothetical protein [Streptomyces sp. NPDC053048]|uniref:hypothetical protein n=1 Tax=Streptomyces sp. NPDC053048 TaxID=3365694 RepID=UPI0037D197A2